MKEYENEEEQRLVEEEVRAEENKKQLKRLVKESEALLNGKILGCLGLKKKQKQLILTQKQISRPVKCHSNVLGGHIHIYIHIMDASPDHITPSWRMCMRGNNCTV